MALPGKQRLVSCSNVAWKFSVGGARRAQDLRHRLRFEHLSRFSWRDGRGRGRDDGQWLPARLSLHPLAERVAVKPHEVARVVKERGLLRAGDGAVGRAPFFGFVFAVEIGLRVIGERGAGRAALLRAGMNETVFAEVEKAGARATTPIVRLALREVLLKPIEARVLLPAHLLELAIDALLAFAQRL